MNRRGESCIVLMYSAMQKHLNYFTDTNKDIEMIVYSIQSYKLPVGLTNIIRCLIFTY